MIYASKYIKTLLAASIYSLSSQAAIPLSCETGDPSGAGPQASVILGHTGQKTEITWYSGNHQESKYLLPLSSSRNDFDKMSSTAVQIKTFVASPTLKFELAKYLDGTNSYSLSKISYGKKITLGCSK